MSEDKALDLLGIKGLSDSVKATTQGLLEGSAAFLFRVCLPAAEEFGLALRDRVSAWKAGNAAKMLSKANTIYFSNNPNPADRLSPRLACIAIEEASWIDDDQIQDMWSGLLASSTSPHGHSDENLIFMNFLKQISSLEVKILRFAVEQAPKRVSPHGLVFPQQVLVPIDKLPELFDIQDLQRLDRELDHLREFGLLGFGRDGGIPLGGGAPPHRLFDAITASPASLHSGPGFQADGSGVLEADTHQRVTVAILALLLDESACGPFPVEGSQRAVIPFCGLVGGAWENEGMARKRGEWVSIGDAVSVLDDGSVPALRDASPQARRVFTQADQVNQLVRASEADPDWGFMARTMALCSLPRSNPGNRKEYKRVNGPFTLYMQSGPGNKLPYGNLPRLILA